MLSLKTRADRAKRLQAKRAEPASADASDGKRPREEGETQDRRSKKIKRAMVRPAVGDWALR